MGRSKSSRRGSPTWRQAAGGGATRRCGQGREHPAMLCDATPPDAFSSPRFTTVCSFRTKAGHRDPAQLANLRRRQDTFGIKRRLRMERTGSAVSIRRLPAVASACLLLTLLLANPRAVSARRLLQAAPGDQQVGALWFTYDVTRFIALCCRRSPTHENTAMSHDLLTLSACTQAGTATRDGSVSTG